MRNMTIGCAGIIVGALIGALLMFSANLFMPGRASGVSLAAAPGQADVSITASTSYVNAQAQSVIKQSGIVKQATVSFAAPNLARVAMVIEASFLGQKFSINANATTRVTVHNSRVVLTIEKVETGGITLPQSVVASTAETLRAQIEDQLNRLIQSSLQGTGLELTDVFTTQDAITFQFGYTP
ncbi:hypothetical protein ANRL1_03790 [Anaerolineae bacterium]|nr:hypothetical protein ANRL1_03790 [Anaerolineae bacterium]